MKFPKVTVYEDCGTGNHDYHNLWGNKSKSVCYRCGQVIETKTGLILVPAEKAKQIMQDKGLAK